MSQYTAAVIGTGPDPANPTVEGFAMGYRHAEAYRNEDRCRLVACADIVAENRTAFADEFNLSDERVYGEYMEMLREVEPDIISVTVPPAIHEEVVVDCARSSTPTAIHCEKPMADTWGGAQRMVQACWRQDVQLTFNRQRRFGRPATEAKRLLNDGAIGSLERIEIGWGDFFDNGAHMVDLAGKFNDERSAEWVLAALDYRNEDVRFGVHQENQMWAQWRYENGVHGLLASGTGGSMIDAALVLRGEDGLLRIDADDGSVLELQQDGTRRTINVGGEGIHGTPADDDRFGSVLQDRSLGEVVDALEAGREPETSGRNGLNTSEILFAGYESVRHRGRVDLPLDIEDGPLEAMVESGALAPVPEGNRIPDGED
jgi:predicted dehydrogenase